MRRREFITLIGGVAAWPLTARAQQGERMRRIGVLMNLATDDPESLTRIAAFHQGLQEVGWNIGRNVQRDGTRYAYRLTLKGVQVALLFLFFHKRLCGPLANSRFHHEPDAKHRPQSQLEAAYHRADKAINQIVGLLAAA